jgi:hypothetical protein
MHVLSVSHFGFSNIFSDNKIPLLEKIGYSKNTVDYSWVNVCVDIEIRK